MPLSQEVYEWMSACARPGPTWSSQTWNTRDKNFKAIACKSDKNVGSQVTGGKNGPCLPLARIKRGEILHMPQTRSTILEFGGPPKQTSEGQIQIRKITDMKTDRITPAKSETVKSRVRGGAGRETPGTVDFLLRRMRRNKDFPTFSKYLIEINQKLSSKEKYLSAQDLANVILKDYALTNKLGTGSVQ